MRTSPEDAHGLDLKTFFAPKKSLDWCLLAIPIAVVLELTIGPGAPLFLVSALAVIPCPSSPWPARWGTSPTKGDLAADGETRRLEGAQPRAVYPIFAAMDGAALLRAAMTSGTVTPGSGPRTAQIREFHS